MKSYQASLAIRQKLAQADPGNAGWQRDLFVSDVKMGDTLTAQGDLAGALKSYQSGLVIAQKLAQADPANAGWQTDLVVSYVKLGSTNVSGNSRADRTTYLSRLTAQQQAWPGLLRQMLKELTHAQ